MLIGEIFGHGVDDLTAEARAARVNKYCPFRQTPCTKSSISDPIGICSLSNGDEAAALCPVRFLEGNRIFADAARMAFGPQETFAIFPEVRILNLPTREAGQKPKKIGKVDFLIGKITGGKVTDFAAIEVQAVYFSGREIRTPMNYFLKHQKLDIENSDRRPDFRSSAQKRLVPQLQLKVPVFRRWGKKFFVVVDTQFFGELPKFSRTTPANSELTWLVYPIKKTGSSYALADPEIVCSEWDEIRNSLREGLPPDPEEIIRELQAKLDGRTKNRPVILKS